MRIHWSILIASELSAVVAGSLYFKKIKKDFLYLYIYVLLGFVTDTWNIIYIKLGTSNNLWGSHIYFPLEFLFLALFYLPNLEPVIKKRLGVGIILMVMMYSILNTVFIQNLNELSHVRAISCIILVGFSLVYFYRVMIESKIRKLSSEPMIWINTSILLFFASVLFYNALFTPVLRVSLQLARLMTTINRILIAVFYLSIAYSFYLGGKQKAARRKN